MDPPRLGAWRDMHRTIVDLAESGEHIVDAASALGTRAEHVLEGTYRQGTSDDGIHPNDHGHAIVAELLTSVVQKLLRLPRVSD